MDLWLFWRNLTPALLAEWPGSFTCHCGDTDTECVSTESSLRRRTFFRCFCWNSNSQLFDHEFGAVPTELFQFPACHGTWQSIARWSGSRDENGQSQQYKIYPMLQAMLSYIIKILFIPIDRWGVKCDTFSRIAACFTCKLWNIAKCLMLKIAVVQHDIISRTIYCRRCRLWPITEWSCRWITDGYNVTCSAK